jgi:hypothetical protein
MRKFDWKKAMLLLLAVVALVAFASTLQVINNKVSPTSNSASPTPVPVQYNKAGLALNSAKLTPVSAPTTSIKTITINLGVVKGIADTGKIQQLSAAIKKYPKHDEVIVTWTVPQPSADYPGSDRLIYNRRKGHLRYESWWSNFCKGNNFSYVTDGAIHSAGKEPPQFPKFGERVEKPEHWIKVLTRLGCRLTSSF